MKNDLLAPNGKPSNLTAEQYKLVRTPAFKNWFGDWINDPENSSKVVDDNGEPLVVYHGTHKYFSVFKTPVYFSSRAEYSKWFGNVVSCFLLIKKPLFSLIPVTSLKHAFSDYCKKNGFDGGIDKYEITNIFFVISPNQIKLADGTNTTFDGNNPDIRFEQGGMTEECTPEYLKMFLGK
jgi:hypothetical protein